MQKMVVWRMIEGKIEDAIKLSINALEHIKDENRTNILQNLAMLHIYSGNLGEAKILIEEARTQSTLDESWVQIIEQELSDAVMLMKRQPDSGERVDKERSEQNFSLDLSQNYPNPGNPSTVIHFALPRSGRAVLRIVNMLGREVRVLAEGNLTAGNHTVEWDGRDKAGALLPSGIYLYTLQAEDQVITKKLMLLK